jgi:glycosyltransferase involved in cell wall biosynthesis
MKILIIGPANPYRGGIAALNERLALQLIDEGHIVDIANFKVQYPGFLFPGKTQYTTTQPDKRLKIERFIHSMNPLNWLKVGLLLKKRNYDLVIVRFWLPLMGPSTGTVCKIIRKNKKTKIIALVDNILPHEKRIGDKQFTQYFINQTDGLIAMSACVFTDLDYFRKGQIKRFTPHPIYDHYGKLISKNEALEKLNLNPEINYLLFFGFIRDYKGLDLLLESLTDEQIQPLNIKLLVAGEFYGNEEKYHQLVAHLGLKEKVIFFSNYIPDEEVNQYFCASSLVVQPYKTATQSGVTQIGYHFNKPMLVTNVGGLSEIIENGKCGYVVDPNSASIANAIADYFIQSRENEMTKEVMKAKEKFTWNKLTQTIFEINNLCS